MDGTVVVAYSTGPLYAFQRESLKSPLNIEILIINLLVRVAYYGSIHSRANFQESKRYIQRLSANPESQAEVADFSLQS